MYYIILCYHYIADLVTIMAALKNIFDLFYKYNIIQK